MSDSVTRCGRFPISTSNEIVLISSSASPWMTRACGTFCWREAEKPAVEFDHREASRPRKLSRDGADPSSHFQDVICRADARGRNQLG